MSDISVIKFSRLFWRWFAALLSVGRGRCAIDPPVAEVFMKLYHSPRADMN